MARVQASLVVEFANEKLKEIWGNKVSTQAKAQSLKNGVLTLYCANSIIAQELNFKERSLIRLVNEKFGSNTIEKLKIVQKGVEKQLDW